MPEKIVVPYVSKKTPHVVLSQASVPSLTTNNAGSAVIHPVVIVGVNGRKFRALLDGGASQSYVSSALIDLTL